MRLVHVSRACRGRRPRLSLVPRGIAALALLSLVIGAAAPPIGAASGRTTLPGSVPAWANSADRVSAANPSDSVGFRVYLGWNSPDAVEALARAVSDPHGSSYGQYLTPAQFRAQFAPSQAQVN